MNELLFRAWDTLTKKWIAKDFTILGEVTCFDIIGQYLRDNLCGKETTLARLEDVIINQFTGRLDKNNKLIYSDDIVKMTNMDCYIQKVELITVVKYNNYGSYVFEFKKINKLKKFNKNAIKPTPTIYPPYLWFTTSNYILEIIGTEMENPELLK